MVRVRGRPRNPDLDQITPFSELVFVDNPERREQMKANYEYMQKLGEELARTRAAQGITAASLYTSGANNSVQK